MLLDLVSPWTAAVEANDTAGAATFRERHTALLDLLRREHTPHTRHLPLLTDLDQLRAIQERVLQPGFSQTIESLQHRAADLGADVPARIVLLPLDSVTSPVTAIPATQPLAVLALSSGDEAAVTFTIPLARALAKLTRWSADNSESAVRQNRAPWDRWELSRTIPLREWLYAEGIGWHLAQALHLDLPLHALFGVGARAWQRLREQEPAARALLVADLDQRGVGLVMRWLMPNAAISARSLTGHAMPPHMGHYLAWRMTAPRVARIGIAAAIRAAA